MAQMHDLFDDFLSRITPTERELNLARQHRDAVLERLKPRVAGIREFLNSGSYIKGTAIRPFEDLDVFVGFNTEEYDADKDNVINRLRYHIGQSFPGSAVRLQAHSVGIQFSDPFRVDVVPGFALKTREGYYQVRDREDERWVTTSIDRQKEFFRKRYDADPRYRDVVKLVKHWKNQRRRKFGGFLMELIVASAFRDGIPHGRDYALHAFFQWVSGDGLRRPIVFSDYYRRGDVTIPGGDPLVVLDPTSYQNNVARVIDKGALKELISAANWARARSKTALNATSRQEASRVWREILPGFPVP